MRKFILFFLLTCAAVSHIFPTPLEELTGAVHAARLRSENSAITEIQQRSPALKLLPMHIELRQYVTNAMSTLDPNLAIETLYLYNKPAFTSNWNNSQRTSLFNQLIAISTLTGIQYYSASRRTMRTFYESSRVIDGPVTKKPLPDPVVMQPPASFTLFARQKDLTFGDNIYRYDFMTVPDAFFFTQENMTPLVVGIIPAVGKNRLRSVMAVIDCGDSLLIYAVSLARAASIPGMGDRIGNSFSNRAEAILKWFSGRADIVFGEKN